MAEAPVSGVRMAAALTHLGVTDVVWIPDSTTGLWEAALDDCAELRLLRVCREGEAWPLAAGLLLGGRRPIIMMQSTGFFESGDALRNIVYDLDIPVYAIIGLRNWLSPQCSDSARDFAAPLIAAWGLSTVSIAGADDLDHFASHYRSCRESGAAGLALLAE